MKKGEEKAVKMSFVEAERHGIKSLTPKDKELALISLASYPVKPYLLAIIDELVRQGIYLPLDKQDAAKMMIEILGKHMAMGKNLVDKKDKQERGLSTGSKKGHVGGGNR